MVGAECEICKYRFRMEFETEKVCVIGKCRKAKGNTSALVCLSVVDIFLVAMLILVVM